MNLYKLLVVILCVPIASFGQCASGESFLVISTNGDFWSSSENEVTISSENGAFSQSFDMSSGNVDREYCIDPGIYTVEMTDDYGDGLNGCGAVSYTHLTLPTILLV